MLPEILIPLFDDIHISTYILMHVLSFSAGITLILYNNKDYKIQLSVLIDLFIGIILSSILGARLMSLIVDDFTNFINNPLIFFTIHPSGLTSYGGILASIIFSLLYLKIKNIDVLKVFDLFSPSIALGIIFSRIGCLLAGCCWGKICDENILSISIDSFSAFSPVYQYYLEDSSSNILHNINIFSTQILFSLSGLMIFISLIIIKKLYYRFSGLIFICLMVMDSVSRFFIDFLRADVDHIFINLTFSQLLNIFIILSMIMLYSKLYRKKNI